MDFLRHIWSEHRVLTAGAAGSLALLLLFLIGQQFEAKALTLDGQWVAVAVLPVLIALLIGGYIKSFKGFGVELEAKLENPVHQLLPSRAESASVELAGDEKQNIEYIHRLGEPEAERIERLVFTEGRGGYYGSGAVMHYFERLRNLKYIEVKSPDGIFLVLLPKAVFCRDDEVDRSAIDEFLQAIESSAVRTRYGSRAVSLTVNESESLIDVLEKMRSEDAAEAVVLTRSGRFHGLLNVHDVEARIADDVLASKRAARHTTFGAS